MKKLASVALGLVSALCASAGLDGVSFTTNDWFDASFTSLAVDTVIATNTTTGITRGAGSWTAAPTNGTAKIVADGEGPSTYLEVKAPGEALTFTPSALGSPTGFETVSAEMRATIVEELPELSGAQAAFMVYDDETSVKPCGYTAAGWTNLVYAGAMADLTNGWFTVCMDFASISGTRCVRYSVKPSGGSLSVLEDSAGETWFPTAGAATTVNAVSLSGTGDCRTINGDSLAEVMVAEVGGVQYSTVNAAIAAANPGDTVSLVRALDGADVAVSKSITLALGSYSLVAAGFSVASGVTLTVTGTGAITTPAITGGGSVAFSNAATLNLRGGASSIASIAAAGDLTVTGCGDIALTGAATVDGALTFTPDSATEVQISQGWTLAISAGSIVAQTIAGGARIETADGLSASYNGFYGSVSGGDIEISGDSTFAGVSPAGYSGTITVASGATLELTDYDYTSLVKFGFNSKDTSKWLFVDDSVEVTNLQWSVNGTSKGGSFKSFGSANAQYVSGNESYFGGQPCVLFTSDYDYSVANTKSNPGYYNSMAWLLVYQKNDTTAGKLMTEKGTSNDGGLKINGSGAWELRKNGANIGSRFLAVDGVKGTGFTSGEASTVMTFTRFTENNNRYDAFASNLECAIAEAIGFTEVPSFEQYAAINAMLMRKWNLTNKTAFPIVSTGTAVYMNGSAIFDLGGLAQTIKSLSGSGTVQNGTLTVTDPISVAVGQTLVIPYGSTYTCASGTGANIDTTAGTVTFLHKAADIDGVAYDTVQGAILAYESGTLTIHENATDIDLGTAEVNISGIVLADGVSAPTFSTTLPWQTTYSEGSLTHARVASTFVYVGPAAYATEASNFEIGGVVASDVPGTGDTVQFDTATTISIGSENIVYSAVILNANVTVIGAGTNYLYVDGYTGAGKLILGDGSKLCSNVQCTIATPLEIAENATAVINVTLTANNDSQFKVSGAMTGRGVLNVTRSENSGYGGIEFSGDTSGYYGTINERQPNGANAKRNSLIFRNSDFSNASVNLTTGSGSGNNRIVFSFSNASSVIKFGSLNGVVSSGSSGAFNGHATIEVGNLGNVDSVSGNWIPDGISPARSPYIRKVGTGTLTTTAGNAYGYILNGGTLRVLATDATTVRTEVKGVSIVSRTETVDAVEYRVYSLAQRGPMVILF